MELIDIYDKNGTRTGKTQDRSVSLGPEEYRMAVGIWIQDSLGRIFLTKRSPEKRYAPNKWENPAGHVKAGEGPVDAVIRELYEETGIQVQKGQITLLGSSCSWPYLGRDFGVRMDVELSKVRLQEGETCDARLVNYGEFRAMYDSGELAASVVDHMEDYKTAFLQFIGESKI